VDTHEARLILGLRIGANEDEIRAAHRRRIRRVHPDAGGSAREAARVNEAVRALRAAGGERPLPHPGPAPRTSPMVASPTDARPVDVDQFFLIDGEPGDLLSRLAEAGHVVGEVIFVDPHGGLLEIVVGAPPAVGQLAVTVGDVGAAGVPVSFTLEPLGVTPAPPIIEVVAALMAELGR
jgi:hypothetical protein